MAAGSSAGRLQAQHLNGVERLEAQRINVGASTSPVRQATR